MIRKLSEPSDKNLANLVKKSKYKANFLWPYKEDSLEQLGYELVNANCEEYRKEIWEELKRRLTKKTEE